MRITENDFQNWWNAPVGLEVKKMLKERQNTIAHSMVVPLMVSDQVQSAIMAGRYAEIDDLLDMNFKELMGEE